MRQRARDVELRHLAGPGEQECSAEDAEPGDARDAVVRGHEIAEMGSDEPRDRKRARTQETHNPIASVQCVRRYQEDRSTHGDDTLAASRFCVVILEVATLKDDAPMPFASQPARRPRS